MTRPVPRPTAQRRKVLYSAAATLLAFAEVGWLLPAAHAPHAPLPVQVLTWPGLVLTVVFVLLAALPKGSASNERGWIW